MKKDKIHVAAYHVNNVIRWQTSDNRNGSCIKTKAIDLFNRLTVILGTDNFELELLNDIDTK